MEYEVEIERVLIRQNDKMLMRINQEMLNQYEKLNNTKFSSGERDIIYSGQYYDYITFEIFCNYLNIEHKPSSSFDNLISYGLYLEYLICEQGNIVVTTTYLPGEEKAKPLYVKGPLEKNGDHLIISVPSNLSSISEYQTSEIKEIEQSVDKDINIHVYRSSNQRWGKNQYFEKLSSNDFFKHVNNKSWTKRLNKFLSRGE